MRSLGIIIIAILLSLSAIGPSLLVLISNDNQELKIAVDLGEGENNSEQEKELDIEDSFFEMHLLNEQLTIQETPKHNFGYTLYLYSLVQEITLPPPKMLV